ncbi:MAG: S-methyl-5-thioribose-1-phosphate isomerase [Chloroflexota bacterium]|nr:S-methyl-5-thioribose-1-phosphate isomerase [Chloroflexota bacterium]
MPNDTSARLQPIEWRDGAVRFLDQTLLPGEERYIETDDYAAIAGAIRRLAIRGAPLIGIAAAYGLAVAARAGVDLAVAASELRATRPTAVNLGWALDRVLAATHGIADPAAAAESEALRIHDEQVAADARISELGAALIDDGHTVLTHCNTGSLATGGIGTALGVLKTAHWQGKRIRVLVDETRPLLQGARLTAWELVREGIPHHVIVDAAAAGLIARGAVQAIVVGADRIAANGDVANKVGTYGLALAAREHGVPLYVAAPASTIDANTALGADIAIEERSEDEVLSLASQRTVPDGTHARNPAFDVTPAALVTAIITERGILRAPYGDAIAGIMHAAVAAR